MTASEAGTPDLSELRKVDLLILVFLLRMNFDNMPRFCEMRYGLLPEWIEIISR